MPKIVSNGLNCQSDNINISSNGAHRINGFVDVYDETTQVHSPKVFAVDSITVNTPAKHVLGSNHGHFIKTHQNMSHINNANETVYCITNGNGSHATSIPRLQPLSACYDRYPKPGSYGSLQVFPMNGINSEINNAKECDRNTNLQLPHNDDELTRNEQERLDEIMRVCADYERQNQNVQSSPIVQNRIKTNGSLPREKKSPLGPNDQLIGSSNVFFPSSPSIDSRKTLANQTNGQHHGYENVRMLAARHSDHSRSDDTNGHKSPMHLNKAQIMNCYENCSPVKRSPVGYVPQSPRTRIKTCISPKREVTSTPLHHQRKAEYEQLVQSFEDKLRMEIQQLRDIRNGENNHNNRTQPPTPTKSAEQPMSNGSLMDTEINEKMKENLSMHSQISLSDNIYGSLTPKSRTARTGEDKPIIRKNLDEKQVAQLKKQRVEYLRKTRDLKSQISELHRQEEEVLREVGDNFTFAFRTFIFI